MKSMKKNKTPDLAASKLFINFQKLFRCMDFGKGMRGRAPAITVRQMQVLSFFNESDEVHISDVSRKLNMSIQSVNNLVKRLEVMGYVERTKNQQDKRLSDIRFTKKGREGFELFRAEQLGFLELLLSQLGQAEQARVLSAIETAATLFQKAVVGIAEQAQAQDASGKREAQENGMPSIVRGF